MEKKGKLWARTAAAVILAVVLLKWPVVSAKVSSDETQEEKIRIQWNGTGKEAYWYQGGRENFQFTVSIGEEKSEPFTASVYCAKDKESITENTDCKENAVITDGQVSFGNWVYDREGAKEFPDQRQWYVVCVTDGMGNTVWSEAEEIRIDEMGPVIGKKGGHPAVYWQFENALYQKQEAEDRIQAFRLKPYLFQGTLLSRTAILITVEVEDSVPSPEEENTDYTGSGISGALLKMNGESFCYPEESAPEAKVLEENCPGWKICSFRLPCVPGEETEYRLEQLELTDLAGNRTVYQFHDGFGPEKAAVDDRAPSITFTDDSYLEKNRAGQLEWYSAAAQDRELYITAAAADRYGIRSIEWYMADENGSLVQGPLTADNPGGMSSVPEPEYGAPDQTVLSSTAAFCAAQTQLYAVRATDWAGHTTEPVWNRDISENRGSKVNIDNRPPKIMEKDGNPDVAYYFSNVKYQEPEPVEDHALTERDHMVNGKLISKTDVTVTVAAEDLPEAAGIRASGIQKITLETDRGEYPGLIFDGGGRGRVCTFVLAGNEEQETVYECRSIRITDYAGNTGVCPYTDGGLGNLTVVVDKKGPVQPEAGVFLTTAGNNYVRTAAGDGLTGWYSAAGNQGKTICATVEDTYGISSLSWYALRDTSARPARMDGCLLISDMENKDESLLSFCRSETFTEDQDQLYGIVAADWAGNQSIFWEDESGDRGSRVCIDCVAPQRYALIRWENDVGAVWEEKKGKTALKQADSYQTPGTGSVWSRNFITLKIYVRDGTKLGLYQASDSRISSDIQQVSVTVSYDGIKETKTEVNTSRTRTAMIAGREYLEFVFSLNWTIPAGTETEKYIDDIVVRDYAGNATSALAQPFSDQVIYVLDNRAPELTVDYHADSYTESERYPDTYFYKKDPVVTAAIRERYFFPEDNRMLRLDCQAAGASGRLDRSLWSEDGWLHDIVFSAAEDGRYCFSLWCSDPSGNLMEGDGVRDGRYVSKYLVLDTTKPVIDITYFYKGMDVTGEITKGNFYAGPVTAEVKITETNFDPSLVLPQIQSGNAADNGNLAVDWDGPWSGEGTGVYRNRITFEAQGNYRFTCTAKDILGWEAEVPAFSHFVIDTSAPVAELLFDLDMPEHGKYYQEVRTARVRVADRSFDPEKAVFSLTSSFGSPAKGEWRHLPGGGCRGDDTGHVDGCVYEAQLIFDQDGDYTAAFQCTDRAGNQSERAETAPFTVDMTPPTAEVVYDHMDAAGNMYYNRKRTAVITVTEHNFYAGGVLMTVTAQDTGGALPSPAISGWTDDGDRHSAVLVYDYDGEFTFHIACTDLAGNEAKPYQEDHFVIDLTPPELEITGIQNMSANNQEVSPSVFCSDENLDFDAVSLELTGVRRGKTEAKTYITSLTDGFRIQYEDFPYTKEMDDLYTLRAAVADRAGNVTEKEILFSVNRFGSVYLFDQNTQSALKQYYLSTPPRIQVTEINVDTLEFREIICSRDGETVELRQGENYGVKETGGKEGWKSYVYDINPENFQTEGNYVITVCSEDRASNFSSNTVKETDIRFAVDTTPPSVVVTGVEDGGQYQTDRQSVTIDVKDNIRLSEVTALVNGYPVHVFTEEELRAADGVVGLELAMSKDWQTLEMKAEDAAGNRHISGPKTVLITKNPVILWYRNTPLFVGSLIVPVLLAAGVAFFFRVFHTSGHV